MNKKEIQKHEFKERISYLDDHNINSSISQSEFKGFYVLMWILTSIFLISYISERVYKGKSPLIEDFFDKIKEDFLLVMLLWPFFYLYSFTGYIIQLLILQNFNKRFITFIQIVTQLLPFVFAIQFTLNNKFVISHTCFIICQTFVFFFKVLIYLLKTHSYTLANRDLRIQYLKEKSDKCAYPKNINFKNFNYFMFAPTLCYEPTYPQVKNIRITFIIRKIYQLIAILLVIYIVYTEYALPIIISNDNPILKLGRMVYPIFILQMSLFLFIFEIYLNIFAELTRFADRQFYSDFWNSLNFQEFNQKWNRPVNEYLYRHVYQELIVNYKFNTFNAQMSTFLYSAILHELIVFCVIRQFIPVFIAFMMVQVPIIFTFSKIMKKNIEFGNIFTWCSLVFGPSLMITSYQYFHVSQ